jgi:hypothetical protein
LRLSWSLLVSETADEGFDLEFAWVCVFVGDAALEEQKNQ